MITLRRAEDRHCIRRGKQELWLTFDPLDRTDLLAGGFGILEALNENRVPPGAVVAPRLTQKNQAIIYVFKGALAQEDASGRAGVIQIGEFKSACSGLQVVTRERNASHVDWTHVMRMSLQPTELGIACAPGQKFFPTAARRGLLCIVASPDGRHGSLCVRQDALIYSSVLDIGQHLVHALLISRSAWLHVVRGRIAIGDLVLAAGDGIGVSAEPAISFTAQEDSEVLLFDLHDLPPTLLPN